MGLRLGAAVMAAWFACNDLSRTHEHRPSFATQADCTGRCDQSVDGHDTIRVVVRRTFDISLQTIDRGSK